MSSELEILQEFPFSSQQEWSEALRSWHYRGDSLRLDWLVHTGGVFRERLEEVLSNKLDIKLKIAMRPDPVTEFEVRHWLETFNRRFRNGRHGTVYLEAPAADSSLQDWNISLRDVAVVCCESTDSTDSAASPASANDACVEEIFKKIVQVGTGDADVEVAVASFRRLWQEQVFCETPWMVFRHWLRNSESRPYAVFSVQREIERLIAFLSPQDEVAEQESLAPGQVMVNPTLEILTRPKSQTAPLLAIVRYRGNLIERDLGLADAALIDAIREDFRADENVAVEIASHESRISVGEAKKVLGRLKLEGFVLAVAR